MYGLSVEIGRVNASDLTSGSDWLLFAVSDTNGETLLVAKKKFFTFNPNADKWTKNSRPKNI